MTRILFGKKERKLHNMALIDPSGRPLNGNKQLAAKVEEPLLAKQVSAVLREIEGNRENKAELINTFMRLWREKYVVQIDENVQTNKVCVTILHHFSRPEGKGTLIEEERAIRCGTGYLDAIRAVVEMVAPENLPENQKVESPAESG